MRLNFLIPRRGGAAYSEGMDASSLALFLKSAFIGLSIAAPVGPIGLLCIQRTLEKGPRMGLATGLGAAAADAVYGAVGAFGVSSLIALLTGARTWLALGGGLFLLWLAWQTWRSPRATQAARAGQGGGLWRSFAGTFALTLSNPMTILSFIAIFAALAGQGPVGSPGWMVLGVLLGSAAWWLCLSGGVALLRHRVGERALGAIRLASAAVLAGFGLYQLAQALSFLA